MAYENPENGRIYLNMKMAPICKPTNDDYYLCNECPVRKICEEHGCKNLNACDEICISYGDEIAEAFGYKKIEYNEYESNLEEQLNSTNKFTHTMTLQCIRDRVNSKGNPVNYRIGDQIDDKIIVDLDTLYFDADGTPYAYGKDPMNMDQNPVNYRLDRFKTILN